MNCLPRTKTTGALHRLALGTAQFGLRYGVANASGQVGAAEVAAILERSRARGLDTLDTAMAYGESEACLGRVGVGSWRVITKLSALPGDVRDISTWVEAQVRQSLERLGIASVDALLFHRPADLYGTHGAELLRAMTDLKARGVIGAAGVSIYAPGDLEAVWPIWRPDIIQAPCSVLDQRLIRSGWLERLQAHGTRVHLRSVFLQGLLLMPAASRPKYFLRWQGVLDDWRDWCVTNSVSPLSAALGFVCGLAGVERLVVGVDSLAHLQEILDAAGSNVPVVPGHLGSDDRDLIEPSRWRAA